MIAYNNRSEAIETVYTYEEWLREYNRQEAKWRIRQRTEHLYYMKQQLSGAAMAASIAKDGITILFDDTSISKKENIAKKRKVKKLLR